MILTKITTSEFSVLTSVEASPELSLTSGFGDFFEEKARGGAIFSSTK